MAFLAVLTVFKVSSVAHRRDEEDEWFEPEETEWVQLCEMVASLPPRSSLSLLPVKILSHSDTTTEEWDEGILLLGWQPWDKGLSTTRSMSSSRSRSSRRLAKKETSGGSDGDDDIIVSVSMMAAAFGRLFFL